MPPSLHRHLFRTLLTLIGLASIQVATTAPAQEAPPNTPPLTPVEVAQPTPDDAIRTRLADIFSALDELAGVQLSVHAGVVTLTGTVPSSTASEDAEKLANRTEGVVLVRNRLEQPVEVSARLAPALEKLHELYRASVRKLPLIGIALAIVAAAILIGNLLYRSDALYRRLRLSTLATNLARRLARLVTIALGTVVALEILDATAVVGALLGVAGLAGIAVGFAFRNIAENYLAGILLSTRNPFEIGDTVEIDSCQGKVARLTSRDTVLVTLDGNHLRIPNATVVNSKLTNFTRNPLRRFDFTVGVSVDLDLNQARSLAIETLRAAPAVLTDPPPSAIIENLGDSTVVIRLLAWIDQRESDFLKTRSESIRLVKAAFDEAGIEMPEPIYRLHLRNLPDTSPSLENPPKKQPASLQAPEPEPDLAPDPAIDAEVERERRSGDSPNLLEPQSPETS